MAGLSRAYLAYRTALAKKMASSGISYRELAARANVSTSTLYEILYGRTDRPTLGVIRRVSDSLGMLDQPTTLRFVRALLAEDVEDNTLAFNLQLFRYFNDWSRTEVAADAQITDQYLGVLERGDKLPSWQTVCALAHTYATSPENLAGKDYETSYKPTA